MQLRHSHRLAVAIEDANLKAAPVATECRRDLRYLDLPVGRELAAESHSEVRLLEAARRQAARLERRTVRREVPSAFISEPIQHVAIVVLELIEVGEFQAVSLYPTVIVWIPEVAGFVDVARFPILTAVRVTSRVASERRFRIGNELANVLRKVLRSRRQKLIAQRAVLVRDPARLWERRRHHADFCRVRIGVGDRAMFCLAVPEEQNPVQPYDPIMINEVNSVVAHYRVVRGMPVTVNLDGAGQVAIIGDREGVLSAARSLIVQLASLHAPDDVRIAAAFPREFAADWNGFDLLPHVVDPDSTTDRFRRAGLLGRRPR